MFETLLVSFRTDPAESNWLSHDANRFLPDVLDCCSGNMPLGTYFRVDIHRGQVGRGPAYHWWHCGHEQ
jgi:hypothetical protein